MPNPPVILLVNGPNLDQLGHRDPKQYGTFTLGDVESAFAAKAAELGVTPRFFQSGDEGALCHAIHEARDAVDGIVLNAGAYTHYSFALLDALLVCRLPVMEVHISDIHAREPFRQVSVLQGGCVGQVAGLGLASYTEGLERLVRDFIIPAREGRAPAKPPRDALELAREEITRTDASIALLVRHRMELAARIAAAKAATGRAVYDPSRERAVIKGYRANAGAEFSDAGEEVARLLMRLSRERQKALLANMAAATPSGDDPETPDGRRKGETGA